MTSLALRAGMLSVVLLAMLLAVWHAATFQPERAQASDSEYARLMGGGARKTTGLPTPRQIGETIWKHVSNPFYDNGPNDKGIAIQLAHSLGRVGLGFLFACAVAIPLGFVIGSLLGGGQHLGGAGISALGDDHFRELIRQIDV